MQAEGEDKLLLARAEDALILAEKRFCVRTVGFLNPHQRMLLEKKLFPPSGMVVAFDGGYDEAERTLLVCHPELCERDREEYLCVLECRGRNLAELSHRDYLGSLMGLGIVRENIGDILVSEEKTFIFMKPDMKEYILQNLTKIGRHGVSLQSCSVSETVVPTRPAKEITGTVAGLRLDAVLSVALGLARGKVAALIKGGQVTCNWETVLEVSLAVKEEDVFSVRGFGRMKLARVGGITRKGRYAITVLRYL